MFTRTLLILRHLNRLSWSRQCRGRCLSQGYVSTIRGRCSQRCNSYSSSGRQCGFRHWRAAARHNWTFYPATHLSADRGGHVCRYGTPMIIRSDRDTQFVNGIIRNCSAFFRYNTHFSWATSRTLESYARFSPIFGVCGNTPWFLESLVSTNLTYPVILAPLLSKQRLACFKEISNGLCVLNVMLYVTCHIVCV